MFFFIMFGNIRIFYSVGQVVLVISFKFLASTGKWDFQSKQFMKLGQFYVNTQVGVRNGAFWQSCLMFQDLYPPGSF